VLPLLGIFHNIWGFPVSSGVLGFLLKKIWGLFDSGQILEMYVALLYFPFKNNFIGVMCRVSTVVSTVE